MHDLIDRILSLQSPGGTYVSEVHLPTVKGEDLNCFVTALVVRELTQVLGVADFPGRAALADSHRRALGYLLRSRYPCYEHAYSFYPHFAHPFWIGGVLPPDADDTCVVGLELVRAGKKPPESLAYVAETYLTEYRATGRYNRYLAEPWHCDGAFLTWFSRRDESNPIDCNVNANVVAFLAAAGLTDHPGYAPAVETIERGLAWAGDDPRRLRRLTPFYPDLGEFDAALDHAVASGAAELAQARARVALAADLERPSPCTERRIFSSVDDEIYWVAPVLDVARQLRRALTDHEDQP